MSFNFQKANKIFSIFMFLIFFVSLIKLDVDLSSFVQENFTLLLIVFLLSLSFMLYELLSQIKVKQDNKFTFSNENKELMNKLSKLSYEEKNILSLFMNNKVQEKALNPNDQAVAWLETIKFIFNTGKIEGNKKIFRIEPTLSKHLLQNPNSLY
ncbi:super-infection exclusion protein B [Acinetobacter sp.]|uniref:super-infection exclusion protein B n=1 Tax=Acinetobacter sp. TaxID=472 RepID=UPI0028A80552|nr:super-infection exclusion protein B [Acinetobacter sp.]